MNKSLKEKIVNVNNEFLKFIQVNTPNIYQNIQSKINNEVLLLLKDEKPRIMVYGIYNAGKSTLVNCLLKEEKATMADRPTTDAIDLYETDKYILIDSPGVDAPIEHEKVTNDFLSKCHAILFVMSSKGGFESRENYTRLIELMNKGLPFIIVLNERSTVIPKNLSEDDKINSKMQQLKDIDDIKDKIMKNVIEIGGDKSIAKRYQVVDVNAKKALVGLNSNKKELFEQGKIPILESKINQVISVEIDKLLIQPINNLKTCISICESELMIQNSTSDSVNYTQLVRVITSKIDNLITECSLIIDNLLNNIYSMSINDAFKNKDREVLESIISDIETKYIADSQVKLHICNDYIQKNCVALLPSFNYSSNDMLTSIDFNIDNISDKEDILADIKHGDNFVIPFEAVKAISAGTATTLGATAALGAGTATTLGTTAALGTGAAAFGLGASALTTVATSTLAPILAPLIGIGAGIATWNQSSNKHEQNELKNINAENEAEEMRIAQDIRIEQEANDATISLKFEIKNTLNNSLELYVNNYKYSVMNKIKEIELQNQENKEETKIKINNLKNFIDELNQIKNSI